MQMKRKLLSLLVLLMTAVTGAWADDYTITLPTVSNGSVVAKVSDVSVTSAAAGATVTLEATPDAGYKLKTISGVYTGIVSETISKGAATKTGTYFRVSGNNTNYGWRIGYKGYTLTISSLSNQNLSQVVLTVGTQPNTSGRNKSHLQADHGTLSATGTASGSTVTITGINSPTVTVSAPNGNIASKMWTFTQAKIDGLGSTALTLTDTGDANVKTFTMPSSNVTVSAEFEEIPAVDLTANEGATGEYWATFYSNASNFKAPEGTQVFKVNLTGTAIEMTEITDRIVKSGQGVVLKKTTSGSITMTPTSSNSSDDYSGNSLVGTMTSITNPGNAYVLNYKAATGAGFYKLKDTGTIGANKAYLVYSAGAREFFGFGETTGIDATLVNSEKVNSEVYDLQGRRVSQPTKGLYIVNGKKYIKK
jgi:hypothetical protein